MRRAVAAAIATVALAACGNQGNVFSLEVGTCFDDQDLTATEVTDVPIVDCEEPHDNEVFHVFDLADGEYPGEATVLEAASGGCVGAFEAFVGTPYLDSQLEVFPLTPTEGSWAAGDREVVCALYDLSGEQLTGTARGSAR